MSRTENAINIQRNLPKGWELIEGVSSRAWRASPPHQNFRAASKHSPCWPSLENPLTQSASNRCKMGQLDDNSCPAEG